MSVVVRDPLQQEVGRGITDARGNYSFEVRANAEKQLSAHYEKIGYFAYPTIRRMSSLKGAQPPVPLSKGSASADYYKAVAAQFAKANAENPKNTAIIVAALAGLPAADKAKLMDQLKVALPPPLFAEFDSADKAIRFTDQISERLRASGVADYKLVKAYPNYPQAGSIWLYGSVNQRSDIKVVEDIAKSVQGVTIIQNDIGVHSQR